MAKIDITSDEAQLVIRALTYLREALIDDALDDPAADHSIPVPMLWDLIPKFEAV